MSQHDPADLADYMREIEIAATALDRDIAEQGPPQAGQAFTSGWRAWLDGYTSQATHWVVPTLDFMDWLRASEGLAVRIMHTDEVWRQAEQWEFALGVWYDEFSRLSGRPSRPRPRQGFDQPEGKRADWVQGAVGWGLLIAGLFGAGYLISSARGRR